VQAQVDALVDRRAEERPHPGPSTVHRRGAIRELQERLYPQRGSHLMSIAESYLTIEQHHFIYERNYTRSGSIVYQEILFSLLDKIYQQKEIAGFVILFQ